VPISIDEFERFERRERRETNAERVVRFLVENSDKAYKATEIADETDVHPNSIQPVLNRLRSRGLVRHKEPYWALGEIERVRDAFAFRSAAQFLDEKLGEESRKEWIAAAATADEEGDE
jgi:Mn-dependent DtxR family transcriptional regulator